LNRERLTRFAKIGTAFLAAVIVLGIVFRARSPGWSSNATSEAAEDEIRLQGSWQIVEARTAERRPNGPHFPFRRIVFRGNKFIFEGPDTAREATFRLNVRANPAEITLTFGRDYQGEVRDGVYALDGENLSLNLSETPGRVRPSTISSGSERGVLYLSCRREPVK
jgi:uncharacterized protein (TIGR03067 family)